MRFADLLSVRVNVDVGVEQDRRPDFDRIPGVRFLRRVGKNAGELVPERLFDAVTGIGGYRSRGGIVRGDHLVPRLRSHPGTGGQDEGHDKAEKQKNRSLQKRSPPNTPRSLVYSMISPANRIAVVSLQVV